MPNGRHYRHFSRLQFSRFLPDSHIILLLLIFCKIHSVRSQSVCARMRPGASWFNRTSHIQICNRPSSSLATYAHVKALRALRLRCGIRLNVFDNEWIRYPSLMESKSYGPNLMWGTHFFSFLIFTSTSSVRFLINIDLSGEELVDVGWLRAKSIDDSYHLSEELSQEFIALVGEWTLLSRQNHHSLMLKNSCDSA